MNYLKTLVFGNQATTKQEQIDDPVGRYIPADQIEDQLKQFSLSGFQLFKLEPSKTKPGQQDFVCEYMNCNLSFDFKVVDQGDDDFFNLPMLVVENEDFQEDQEQTPEEKLPLTPELIFMKYINGSKVAGDDGSDEEDPRHGYVFYYKSLDHCRILEFDVADEETAADLARFEDWVCKVLYVQSEHQRILSTQQKSIVAIQQKEYRRYMLECSLSVLLKHQSVADLFSFFVEGAKPEAERENRSIKQDQNRRLAVAVKEEKLAFVSKKLANLKVGQEELQSVDSVQLQVEEVLIKVHGSLHKYDPSVDADLPIKDNLFFEVDKIRVPNQSGYDSWRYLLHVVDMKNEISYCRTLVTSSSQIQIVAGQNKIMWIGDQRSNGQLPGYCFYFKNAAELLILKGVITKAIFETNHLLMEQEVDSNNTLDDAWLEDQIVVQEAKDFGSEESQSDYNFKDSDSWDYNQDLEQMDEDLRNMDAEDFEIDKDLDPEVRDGLNKECIQAFGYDRAFVLNGPVVKVYKSDVADDGCDGRRLNYLMHLPLAKDKDGNYFEPSKILLHNNESSMLMVNQKNSNRIINFDLEAGKVVEEFNLEDDMPSGCNVLTIGNEFKNSQKTASQLFNGISARSVFTVDPRLASQSKVALKRDYKTDPMFSALGTTLAGNLAIGSANGSIRLYNEVGKDARTLLPGLGDPIKAVEVSIDGQWVLATTKSYLLLIPTTLSNGKTGFETRMGKEKPKPTKLSISMQDVAKFKMPLNFTAAKFNNFSGSQTETAICATTGNFVITWNFMKVKNGNLTYKLKQVDSAPVDSQFKIDAEEHIILTDEKTVGVQRRKKMVA